MANRTDTKEIEQFWVQPLGDDGVGRETFMKMLMMDQSFGDCQEYDPSNDFEFSKIFEFDGVKAKISCVNKHSLADLGDAEQRKESIESGFVNTEITQIIKQTDAFIFIYSKIKQSTFISIDKFWYPQIVEYGKEKQCPMILMATKGDLDNDLIQIKDEEGKQLAEKLNMKYVDLSLKTCSNSDLQEILHTIYKQMRENRKCSTNKGGECCHIL